MYFTVQIAHRKLSGLKGYMYTRTLIIEFKTFDICGEVVWGGKWSVGMHAGSVDNGKIDYKLTKIINSAIALLLLVDNIMIRAPLKLQSYYICMWFVIRLDIISVGK